MKEKSYMRRNSEDVLREVGFFCEYYHLIKKYIDKGTIKSSLDRGTFNRPHSVLDSNLRSFLGKKSDSKSYAYGPEKGNYDIREKISFLENIKYNTKYLPENVIIVAGAWSGVELVVEELANLKGGKTSPFTLAVIGPTHYQMFHRAINMLGINVIGFDFVKSLERSTPQSTNEINDILKINPSAVFIANPNNPNGEYFSVKILEYLINECSKRKIYVIIDEIQDFFKLSGGLGYDSWIQK